MTPEYAPPALVSIRARKIAETEVWWPSELANVTAKSVSPLSAGSRNETVSVRLLPAASVNVAGLT
jgi:hypothetical protein